MGINKPKLSDETFFLLRDIVYKRSGIFIPENKKYLLETRLARRLELKDLKTFEDYYYFLTYDAEKERELQAVCNSIVTNETSFFRDGPQLEAFRKGVVSKVIEEKSRTSDRNIRIWSAACSTGEEPLTISMMLHEDGVVLRGWNVDILGSDISDGVLKAAAGVYEKYSLRNTPEEYIRKYFTGNGDTYTINGKARSLVRYKKINLVEANETRMVRGMDIVFCRNVLIYFDDASKKKAIGHLYDSMEKGGYLLVGFSESLHSITRLFRPVSVERSVVYKKI
ncbi:MAG: protein-glutamate O-methyltransferase CheR [Deltaproteobacteria bacterium]|nr:protein-glutamate O-methyltransferase CheR [Deltaproteobacteria bacterium]MBZ0219275.1 protein-glutamate O-methyltransferase CheR [Deltaproteobacteria bacterium]